MTDKVQKIREEVERLQKELIQEKEKGFGSDIDDACILELQNVLTYIDSLKEEPKFKTGDRIKPVDSCLGAPRTILEVCDGWYVTNQGTLDFEFEDNWEAVEEPVSEGLEEASKNYALNNTPWDDCKDEIQEAFKAGANWQKEQFEKNRLAACDRQTEEEAEIESDFVMGIIEKEHRQPTFDDAIKYGMRLQKEQMMAKAIDGDVTFDYYGDDDKTYGCIAHDSFCLEDFGLKDREKVKMILIKE